MTLTGMRRILRESGIRPSRSLGQNFLFDRNQIVRIADRAAIRPDDPVLEIGPGLGSLTEEILSRGARLLAIEKDRRLAAALRSRLGDREGLELVEGDAMDYLDRRGGRDWSGWKLVANLPYSAGSALLSELALGERPPGLMVVTLQREVVVRIAARPGTRDYGIPSLILQNAYRPGAAFRVPASCFFPRPEVESACLALTRRECPLVEREALDRFLRLIRTGFGQRRKILFNLLRTRWPEDRLRAGFAELGIGLRDRAETVGVETFAALARRLEGAEGEE